MAANLLPRNFRKRVARQKALLELDVERQKMELRDQQMSIGTMNQIGSGLGIAKGVYDMADKIVPMFATKGDKKQSPTTLSQDVESANKQAMLGTPGPARRPVAAAPAGGMVSAETPGAPAQAAPPQGSPPFSTDPGPRARSDMLDRQISVEEDADRAARFGGRSAPMGSPVEERSSRDAPGDKMSFDDAMDVQMLNLDDKASVQPWMKIQPPRPTPTRQPLAGMEREGRRGNETDWLVPGQEMDGTMDIAMRRAAEAEGVDPGMAGSGGNAYYEQVAPDLRLAGGRPQMPAPLAGMRFPSQIRYEEGMKGVDAMMAQSERDIAARERARERDAFLNESGASGERLGQKFDQQRAGPLRGGIGNQSRPDVGGSSFAFPRGGGQRVAQAPQVPQGQNDQQKQREELPRPPWADQQQQQQQQQVPELDQLRAMAAEADPRYDTYAETAAAIRDAAQRGDRERVQVLLKASQRSRLSDVAPTNMLEMMNGSHLDAARAKLLEFGKIDPMLESHKETAKATARSTNANADTTEFNLGREKETRDNFINNSNNNAYILADKARVTKDLNDNAVAQAKIETKWRPGLHRSTLASQAEARADSRNQRGWRNQEKPRQLMRADEANFESALAAANAQGQRVNPYYTDPRTGQVVEMTVDQQRDFFQRNGRLPNVESVADIVDLMPFGAGSAARSSVRPGAAAGRSVNAAGASASQADSDRRFAMDREREKRIATTSATGSKKTEDDKAAAREQKRKDVRNRVKEAAEKIKAKANKVTSNEAATPAAQKSKAIDQGLEDLKVLNDFRAGGLFTEDEAILEATKILGHPPSRK
jgi:hypothetical protein